jgi:hypothetical protein
MTFARVGQRTSRYANPDTFAWAFHVNTSPQLSFKLFVSLNAINLPTVARYRRLLFIDTDLRPWIAIRVCSRKERHKVAINKDANVNSKPTPFSANFTSGSGLERYEMRQVTIIYNPTHWMETYRP